MMWEIELLVLDLSLPVIFFLSLVLLLDFLQESQTERRQEHKKTKTEEDRKRENKKVRDIQHNF